MTQIIYADLLFIINLLADFIILFLTGRFSGVSGKLIKTLLAAVLGAFFSVIVICQKNDGTASVIFVLSMPPLMCLITFGKRSPGTFGRLIFYFFFSSIILYGGIYAMVSFLIMLSGNGTIYGNFILTVVLLISAFFVYLFFSALCTQGIKRSGNTVEAELCDGHRTYHLRLLVDSGNLVKDPFSSKPVVIVSEKALCSELTEALGRPFDKDDEYCGEYKDIKPRVIPVKTVSGAALLYAFIPESMFIITKAKKHKADCIIAIDSRSNNFFGNDGVIPNALLQTI